MNQDAVDLIDELLKLNPMERLGCGKPGSGRDYETLKKHKFFNGLNFERMREGKISPPIPQNIFQNLKQEDTESKNFDKNLFKYEEMFD